MLIASRGTVTIAPNAGLILFSVLMLVVLLMGCVTAAKGRWGWLAVGFFVTGGLAWLIAGLLEAMPGSLWSRLSRRRPDTQ